MASSFQCATSQKLEKEAPTDFENVYFQDWNGGANGSGSGTNLFITLKDNSIELDKVYFRGKMVKLEHKTADKPLYIGRFKTKGAIRDITISLDPEKETKNTVDTQEEKEKIPFELKDTECVVSYNDGGKTKYYKITNVKQKETLNYPSARPQF